MMGAFTLRIIVLVNRDSHQLSPEYPENLPLYRFGVDITPNLLCSHVANLEIPLGELISDNKKYVPDMLANFYRRNYSVIGQ